MADQPTPKANQKSDFLQHRLSNFVYSGLVKLFSAFIQSINIFFPQNCCVLGMHTINKCVVSAVITKPLVKQRTFGNVEGRSPVYGFSSESEPYDVDSVSDTRGLTRVLCMDT